MAEERSSDGEPAALQAMWNDGFVPTYSPMDEGTTEQDVAALRGVADGGAGTFAIALNGPNAEERALGLIEAARTLVPQLHIGIGAAYYPDEVQGAVEAGATFVMGPGFSAEIADICDQRSIPYIPGIATLNEAISAWTFSGVSMVNLYPASQAGGAQWIRHILDTRGSRRLRWPIMASGGIPASVDGLRPYFSAGAACVALSSALFSRRSTKNTSMSHTATQVRRVRALIQGLPRRDGYDFRSSS